MDNLTPTGRLVLAALGEYGPGTIHQVCERTGRRRLAIDKAISGLAKAGLVVRVEADGDSADDTATRWQMVETSPVDDKPQEPAETIIDPDASVDVDSSGESGPSVDVDSDALDLSGGVDSSGESDLSVGVDSSGGSDLSVDVVHEAVPAPDEPGFLVGEGQQPDQVLQPKLCRGCQSQMPVICECCWQKTPVYCGKCRRAMPQVRRGEPREPVILSSGLPKLRPGELEQLVEKVMRDNPLPHHVGVTGWTAGRVVIFLPGRSAGAIGNALSKLANTGVAELIGEQPLRYQLVSQVSPPNEPSDHILDHADHADNPDRADQADHGDARRIKFPDAPADSGEEIIDYPRGA